MEIQMLAQGWGIFNNGNCWVLRNTECIAQGCGCPHNVGDSHPNFPMAKCVGVYPPTDCVGGEIVWEAPFKGAVII